MREEVNKIIEDMKHQGVIEESLSPWVSPAVMVKKKDGTIRFCVDYRKLNAVTVRDSYLLPRIDDILDQLCGNSWFSTLDLKSGYWQVKIRPENKDKTAFSIGNGLWQFTVMPFGRCNVFATFERLMEKVLQQLLYKICLVYLDDVIIFGKNFEDMLSHLKQIFLQIRSANLKLNPKKCSSFEREIKYLGHVISETGVTTDPEKISTVKDWPVPQTKKQVCSFLGFCSYYKKFVKGFSLVAKPLFSLTENLTKFVWTEQCEAAFKELKKRLVSSPILSFPRDEGQFILDTDASNHGIGAVLSQVQDGTERVIAYFSRVLRPTIFHYGG
ncbi:krab-a domain-containing protein [Lasius niger]|uniref:RNA-directed DNA polymerase n=1 Tax=Lasius niger TaxID=67767 RepID=A0A0J7K630_LASNI|nr:krab-a domain-containing protein [Lasius niger]